MNLSAEKFYLPYQFVQVTGKCNGKDVPLASAEALKQLAANPARRALARATTYGSRDIAAGASCVG